VARCAAAEKNGKIATNVRSRIDRVRARVIMTPHNNSLGLELLPRTTARIGQSQYRHFLLGEPGRGRPLPYADALMMRCCAMISPCNAILEVAANT
jgi:hypothetical protein